MITRNPETRYFQNRSHVASGNAMKWLILALGFFSILSLSAEQIPIVSYAERLESCTSSASDLILIAIESPAGRTCEIAIETSDWLSWITRLEKREFSKEEFISYMEKNETKRFEVSENDFDELSKSKADLLPEHAVLKSEGREKILKQFYRLQAWSIYFPDEDIYWVDLQYGLKLEGKELISLARLLIECGFRVYRDCETGRLASVVIIPTDGDSDTREETAPERSVSQITSIR